MKNVFALVILFLLAGSVFGQVKKPETPIYISAQLKILQKQKAIAEKKLKSLESKNSPEYVEIVSLKSEIEKINQSINKLSTVESANNNMQILDADLNSAELMKIIVIQNQKIIELLEKLANQKQ